MNETSVIPQKLFGNFFHRLSNKQAICSDSQSLHGPSVTSLNVQYQRTHIAMDEVVADKQTILADAALMQKIANGDGESCRVAMERHLTQIYRVAYRILHDPNEADDVVQEAFIKLWQLAPAWKPQAKILTWLYRVTMNGALDRLRKRPRGREVALAPYTPYLQSTATSETNLETETQLAAIADIHKAIKQLSKRYQTVLTLCYFENLKIKEAAEVMQISARATESLLKRARTRLKSILQKYSSELPTIR